MSVVCFLILKFFGWEKNVRIAQDPIFCLVLKKFNFLPIWTRRQVCDGKFPCQSCGLIILAYLVLNREYTGLRAYVIFLAVRNWVWYLEKDEFLPQKPTVADA